jgi:hypothetical protein
MSKRTRKSERTLLDALAEDSPDLHIRLAGGARVAAHRQILAWMCTCVHNLPAGDTWDVSGLLVEGQPVTRPLVALWLQGARPAALGGQGKGDKGANTSGCLARTPGSTFGSAWWGTT